MPKDPLVCESCIKGKITKRPFITKGHKAKESVEFSYTDNLGPFNVHAWGVCE